MESLGTRQLAKRWIRPPVLTPSVVRPAGLGAKNVLWFQMDREGLPLTRKTWVFDPDHEGVRIPEPVQSRAMQRIERYAQEHFRGRYTRLDGRFRGQFCYVDAYTEPEPVDENWPPADWGETHEEYLERLRNTPTHLCRASSGIRRARASRSTHSATSASSYPCSRQESSTVHPRMP